MLQKTKPQLPFGQLMFATLILMGIAVPLLAQTTGQTSQTGNVQVITSEHETKVIASKTLLQVIQDGGPMMFLIGICSVVLLVFVFERSVSLRKGRIIPRPFVKRFMQQLREGELDADTAMELCQKNRSPGRFQSKGSGRWR